MFWELHCCIGAEWVRAEPFVPRNLSLTVQCSASGTGSAEWLCLSSIVNICVRRICQPNRRMQFFREKTSQPNMCHYYKKIHISFSLAPFWLSTAVAFTAVVTKKGQSQRALILYWLRVTFLLLPNSGTSLVFCPFSLRPFFPVILSKHYHVER